MVRSLCVAEFRIPLHRPLSTARGTVSHRRIVLVGIEESGVIGWGEAAPYPGVTPESTDDVWRALRDEGLAMMGDKAPAVPVTAAAAIDQALEDLAARRGGESLTARLGGSIRSVRACAAVGLEGSPAETVDRVGQAVEAGIREVKIKIEPGRDLHYLQAVRDRYPDLAVAADANGSYRIGDPFLDVVDGLALSYLEQPLAPDHLAGHSSLRGRLATPVCLDESTTTSAGARVAMEDGVADIISLKPGLLGVSAVRRLLERAERAGVVIKIGGLVETSVGRAHALALATRPLVQFTDLVPPLWLLAGDVSPHPWRLVDGYLSPPEGPGLGVKIDPLGGTGARYLVRAQTVRR
ncbi:MAG: hypothetical protein OXS29_18790 [bacterium]|nr:hypothetical protein [bacterium]MDE0289402.1 hypothetical protein [bacterium]MDE0439472.1 hypothetical protein [bacterium]